MKTSGNAAGKLVELNAPAGPERKVGPKTDREIADRIKRAIGELQDAMDAALLAGLLVEPEIIPIENRLAQCGARIDSFVCRVGVYRRLA